MITTELQLRDEPMYEIDLEHDPIGTQEDRFISLSEVNFHNTNAMNILHCTLIEPDQVLWAMGNPDRRFWSQGAT